MLTDKQVERISSNIQAILERKGMIFSNFQEDTHLGRKEDRIDFVSDPMSVERLKAFKYIIKEYSIRVLVWIFNAEGEIRWQATPGFRYEHYDGGRNGHDMNFKIHCNLDGTECRVIENGTI